VVFSFNKFWGNLSITVDNTNVVRAFRLASLDLGAALLKVRGVGRWPALGGRVEVRGGSFLARFVGSYTTN
jgi:hypothetical protein